jgi:hypothetical protein
MLDACWNSRNEGEKKLWDKARFVVGITIPDCITLLEKVGERWSEAGLCADHLKPVVEDVATAFSQRVADGLGGSEELEMREEKTTQKLMKLLFPDGPLAWNVHSEELLVDAVGIAPISGPMPDLENFRWDNEWDLADLLNDPMN